MVRQVRPKRIDAKQRERDKARRRVIYFPNGDINEEFARVAKEEGFVHTRIGQNEEEANCSAFVIWLFKQHELRKKQAKEREGLQAA